MKNEISASLTGLAFIDHKGMASTYLVEEHLIVNMYYYTSYVFMKDRRTLIGTFTVTRQPLFLLIDIGRIKVFYSSDIYVFAVCQAHT